jgi:membrane protein implicated in regulation of membrane protease activity
MPDWLPWLIAAGVLGLVELHTLTLVLGMLAVAALPAAATAALGGSPAWQVLVFAIASVLALAVVRPVARRHRNLPPGLRTGAAALVGQRGIVVTAIGATENGQGHGQVRIGGEVWSARSYADDQLLPVGAVVDVVGIDGATAVVLGRDPQTNSIDRGDT